MKRLWCAILILYALPCRADFENVATFDSKNCADPQQEFPGEDSIVGMLDGKLFRHILAQDMPGRSDFLIGVSYAERDNLVWILSHYRYRDGVTLFDVGSGQPVKGFGGWNFQLSPDRAHIAYTKGGAYGALHAVAVDDWFVFPRVRKQTAEEAQLSHLDSLSLRKGVPDQAPASLLHWLDENTIAFVVDNNAAPKGFTSPVGAVLLWYVRVSGLRYPYEQSAIRADYVELCPEEAVAYAYDTGKREHSFPPLNDEQKARMMPIADSLWDFSGADATQPSGSLPKTIFSKSARPCKTKAELKQEDQSAE